jgi:hypothetical protein
LYLQNFKSYVLDTGENCTARSFMTCKAHKMLLGLGNKGDGRGMWNVKGVKKYMQRSDGKVCIQHHPEDIRVHGRIILKLT